MDNSMTPNIGDNDVKCAVCEGILPQEDANVVVNYKAREDNVTTEVVYRYVHEKCRSSGSVFDE